MWIALLLLILGINAQDDNFDDENTEKKAEFDERIYSCIVLARQQLSFYGSDELVKIVKSQSNFEEQTLVWKKLYGGHVKHCADRLENVEEVLQDVTSDNFVFSKYIALFLGFDFDIFKTQNWPRELSEQDQQIWTQIEDYESALAMKKQEDKKKKEKQQQDEFDDLEYLKTMAGQSSYSKETRKSNNTKGGQKWSDIVILIVIFGSFGIILFIGYQQLSKAENQQNKKKE